MTTDATTAQDLMTADPHCITGDTSLAEAARVMRDLDVGFLPIVTDEQLTGVLTDRDIVVRCVAQGLDPAQVSAGSVAETDPVTVAPDDSVDDVLNTMAEFQIRRLLVVRDGVIVGVISEADIAREGNTEEVADTVQAVTQA